MKKPIEVIKAASPEVQSVINQVLKIHQEGKHYRDLPGDMERDFCERIIKVIKDEVKT
ncbi:hypothetical protein [Pseudomonas chlororaphis]|uniref:hypothetical protein n=1 Tax=Pseudomonas chlororaphis TaxID=587753 RepID=UPI001CF4A442|nr:hypothetical protein [Pseudomonas chlororaphis]UCR86798.1 hypothetical protein K9V45_12075 [Pseudomonas chlororaphis]